MRGQGRTDLANISRKIISDYKEEKNRGLEIFVRELCKSERIEAYPKIVLQPQELDLGEIPRGYQNSFEFQIVNKGRGFAWGNIKIENPLPGIIIPKTFDSSKKKLFIQLDTLQVKPRNYNGYIVIELEGISEPCKIPLNYTVREIKLRINPKELNLGDISYSTNEIKATLTLICETFNGRIGGRIKGQISANLLQILSKPFKKEQLFYFEGSRIDINLVLDTSPFEAGTYEDKIYIETNIGNFQVPVYFKKHIRWDIVAKFIIVLTVIVGTIMWLIRFTIGNIFLSKQLSEIITKQIPDLDIPDDKLTIYDSNHFWIIFSNQLEKFTLLPSKCDNIYIEIIQKIDVENILNNAGRLGTTILTFLIIIFWIF